MKKGIILAVVTGAASDDDVLDAALAFSKLHESHIEVLHPRLDPYRALAGFIDGVNGLATADIVSGIRQDGERRRQTAFASFNSWSARHGLRPDPDGAKSLEASAGWRDFEGSYEGAMTQHGRLADFIVVAQPKASGRAIQDAVVESAIFDTGRPVLCVPAGFRALDPRSVAILWNGSLEAARAVGDAMPLLAACSSAVVVTAGQSDGADPTELVERLVQRGIEARTKRVSALPESNSRALVEALNEGRFGLVIMGGYGHTRLREMVLGGLTRQMLAEAKIPVLLAH